MTTAIGCSVIFLVMYVAYHMSADSTKFGDLDHNGIVDATELAAVGSMRLVYFLILITHIILSIIIIPMVLFTYVRALSRDFDRHKKLARITFPIWLYVAITGVVVYLMIAPYYAN
jgi:putative membrane protein